MNISEIISNLQEVMDTQGDLEVVVYTGGRMEQEIESIEVWEDLALAVIIVD